MLRLLQGFRDFIMRGNVIDLAVGIVIGAAFTGLVTNFTGAFIEPLLKVFSGGKDQFSGGTFKVHGVPFEWSQFANALVTFLITAAVLYFFVVTPMNMINERRRRGIEPEPQLPSDEAKLLMEIRDLLAANGLPQPAPTTAGAPADRPGPAAQKAVPVARRRRDTGGGGTSRR
jgi:large conductance mechanosensitive channel